MERLPPIRWLVLGGVGLACGLAAVLIAVSQIGSGDDGDAPPTAFATDSLRVLDGIPQDGLLLGDRTAPVTLVEYADLQCPLCARFTTETAPGLIREYVRPGKVRLELRPIAFIGADSTIGVRAVLAAGMQDRLWQLAALLYENRSGENTGWLSEEFVEEAARAIPGLDADEFVDDLGSSAVSDLASAIGARAKADRVGRAPFFLIGRTGGPTRRLGVDPLEPSAFRRAADALLE